MHRPRGFVAEEDAARVLLVEHVAKKKIVLDRIAASSISNQAQFALITTVERSLTWTFSATRPNVTQHESHLVDGMLADAVVKLIPQELAEETGRTRVIINYHTAPVVWALPTSKKTLPSFSRLRDRTSPSQHRRILTQQSAT